MAISTGLMSSLSRRYFLTILKYTNTAVIPKIIISNKGWTNQEFLDMKPKESKRGRAAQWIAHNKEVVVPQTSIFFAAFIVFKCNSVANITNCL